MANKRKRRMATANYTDYKPPFLKWWEDHFWADRYVIHHMNWLQRLLYRSLLQAAFFCETRPYLPDDDNELWMLAGAESLEMWKANREIILAKFISFKDSKERSLLRNKRLDEEWNALLENLKNARSAGLASAKARGESRIQEPVRSTKVQRPLNERREVVQPSNTDTEPETESKTESESSTETETESVDRSSGSVSGAPHKRVGHPSDGSDSVGDLVSAWFQVQPGNGTQAQAVEVFSQLDSVEALRILSWLPNSNYWGKPGAGAFKGPAGFLKAYDAVAKSCTNYLEAREKSRSRKGRSRFIEDEEGAAEPQNYLLGEDEVEFEEEAPAPRHFEIEDDDLTWTEVAPTAKEWV